MLSPRSGAGEVVQLLSVSFNLTEFSPAEDSAVSTGVLLDADALWVTGGPGTKVTFVHVCTLQLTLLTTERLTVANGFEPYADLPEEMYNHCVVDLGDGPFFFTEGVQLRIS